MPFTETLVYAAGTLTLSANPLNTETVTVGSKTYTFQTSLTNVDGNVLIGANAAASLQNLFDAINLTGTSGTQYAAAMTINANVKATSVTATTVVVKSKVPGVIGNLIASTETIVTGGSWGAATLASGAGSIMTALDQLIATEQLSASAQQALHDLSDPSGTE